MRQPVLVHMYRHEWLCKLGLKFSTTNPVTNYLMCCNSTGEMKYGSLWTTETKAIPMRVTWLHQEEMHVSIRIHFRDQCRSLTEFGEMVLYRNIYALIIWYDSFNFGNITQAKPQCQYGIKYNILWTMTELRVLNGVQECYSFNHALHAW